MHNFSGGRSDLFYSGGRWSKGGEGIFSKFRGELAKRGELQNSGGYGPWMKLCLENKFHKNIRVNPP